jgi:hypothetical protein
MGAPTFIPTPFSLYYIFFFAFNYGTFVKKEPYSQRNGSRDLEENRRPYGMAIVQ